MQTVATKERNCGIDLLRIIAMFMVCMIHMNLFTSAISPANYIPGREYFYYVGIWTESVGFVGVNLYALITGYVCLNSRWRLSRYIELWVQVAYYSIGLLIIGLLLSHYSVLPWEISWKKVLIILIKLPLGSTYWYFVAYSALFLIMPFLNKFLQMLQQREYILLLGGCLLIIPCSNVVNPGELYASGYNVIWLTVLYATGGYFKRFSPRANPVLIAAIAFACTLQPMLSTILNLPDYLSYCSPVMVLYACCLFMLLYQLRIVNHSICRFITWLASLSFGVYLIHVHPWSWKMLNMYVPKFNEYLDYPWWISILGGAVLYILCSLLDWVRSVLFVWCRVRLFSEYVADVMQRSVKYMMGILIREN